MWGNALLISPVLEPGVNEVTAYFPKSRWYSYYTGAEISGGGMHKLYAAWNEINLHLKGGTIIPVQKPASTTMESRTNGLGLIISLDESFRADGELLTCQPADEVSMAQRYFMF